MKIYCLSRNHSLCALSLVAVLWLPHVQVRAGDVVLDFSDVPQGTLVVASPYSSQGFTLQSTSGGFVFNSPDTGNGSPQTPGNNQFYAGALGLAAFAPATITVRQTDDDPFSLLSIDVARLFAFDLRPSTTFTGTLADGSSVMKTITVSIDSPPLQFQTFDFTGFTNLKSVSWEQDVEFEQVLHQFGNIHLSPASAVPEPSALKLLALGAPLALALARRLRRG